jgi:hypothetical protein
MFIAHIHTKHHIIGCNVSLVIAIKTKNKRPYISYGSHFIISYLQKNMSMKMAYFYKQFCVENLMSIKNVTLYVVGRAIAQAVSRRLPTAAARVQTRGWCCGIL